MTGRAAHPTSPRVIPPGPADPRGRDLLARAVVAATWYLEVRAGRRPVSHLQEWVSPAVARQLDGLVRRRRRLPRDGAASISLMRVWAQRHDGLAHVVVVLREHRRARPVALALEVGSPDPRIVALGLPEDRVASPAATTTTSDERAVDPRCAPDGAGPPILDDAALAGPGTFMQRPVVGTPIAGLPSRHDRTAQRTTRVAVPEGAATG